MPTITRLEPAKRRGRIRVEVDGQEFATVPETVVIDLGLRAGEVLESPRLDDIVREAARADAVQAALHSLGHRARSRTELIRHLRRKSHELPAIDFAVRRCEALGYLDDSAFARAFVRDRIRLRPRGRQRLRQELLARGVSGEDAAAAIDAVFKETGTTESDLLIRVAERRARSLETAERAVARRRLYSWLTRRGFAHQEVRAVVDALLPSESADRPPDPIV